MYWNVWIVKRKNGRRVRLWFGERPVRVERTREGNRGNKVELDWLGIRYLKGCVEKGKRVNYLIKLKSTKQFGKIWFA